MKADHKTQYYFREEIGRCGYDVGIKMNVRVMHYRECRIATERGS